MDALTGAERRGVYTAAKGWLFDNEAEALHRYASDAGGDVLEVGAYCGKSSIILGDAVEGTGRRLWSVDTHQGSPEMQPGKENHDKHLVVDGRHETLFEWRQNIVRAELVDTVVAVVGASTTVGAGWGSPLGMVFIDADHGPPVMHDCQVWAPHVEPGGVLAFHDSSIPWVRRAVELAKNEFGFDEVEQVGDDLTFLCRRS